MAARRVGPSTENWNELEVGISGFLFCSILLVFDSFIIFHFPSSGGNQLMGKGSQSPGEGRNHKHSTQEAAHSVYSVCSVSRVSAAQLTPQTCTFCRWAGCPPNRGEHGGQLLLVLWRGAGSLFVHSHHPEPCRKGTLQGRALGERALLLCFQTLRNSLSWPERVL